MTGKNNGPAPRRLHDFGGVIFAALSLSMILGSGPLLAQAAFQTPEAGSASPLPAAPEGVSAAVTAAKALPAGSAPAMSSDAVPAAPQAEAASLQPHALDAILPSSLPSSALPRDLSPWGMFLGAVVPVKIVMAGLALASLATWTVWLAKTIELWTARRSARRGLEILAHAQTLRAAEKDIAHPGSPLARLAAAAAGEVERSGGLAAEGVKDRAAILLSRIEAQAGRAIMRGTGILATVGATAPFVGLFGTVWGIMDSFIGISKTNTTNLAVVAPGIAEALLATAMGLVAAIPAVIMYNAFARAITGYRAQLGDAAAEILRHLSRDLDREGVARDGDAAIIPMRQSAE